MLLIDPNGLFFGTRLRRCMDYSRLLFPHLYLLSNGYGRLELDYDRILSTAFAGYTTLAPTEERLAEVLIDYSRNALMFLYARDGKLWGQWDSPARCVPRYKTAEDRRSPDPNDPEISEIFGNFENFRKSRAPQDLRALSSSSFANFRKFRAVVVVAVAVAVAEISQNQEEERGEFPKSSEMQNQPPNRHERENQPQGQNQQQPQPQKPTQQTDADPPEPFFLEEERV